VKLIHCLSGHGIRPASYYDDHPCINHPPDKNPMAIKPTRPFLQLKSKLNPRNTALPTRATVRNISAYSQLVSVSKSPDAFPDKGQTTSWWYYGGHDALSKSWWSGKSTSVSIRYQIPRQWQAVCFGSIPLQLSKSMSNNAWTLMSNQSIITPSYLTCESSRNTLFIVI